MARRGNSVFGIDLGKHVFKGVLLQRKSDDRFVLTSYASREVVPTSLLDKERAIYRAQMDGSGKPAGVIDKIVEGKLGSFYKQVVLPDQESIRDSKMSVKDVLGQASKALGAPVSVTRFARLKVGDTNA